MKYSGIEWIGEIPDNWVLERIQWHLDEIKESNNPIKTEKVLSLTNKLGVIPYEEKGEQGNKAKENIAEYKLAYPNTIVANSMNILIGSVGRCNYYGCVSPVYYVFKPKENENIDFLNYIFQLDQFQRELRRYANGILEIRLRLSSADILKRIVAFPPSNEQEKIVDYLKRKSDEIKSLINIENLQIEKLEEYRLSLIGDEVFQKEKNGSLGSTANGIVKIPSNWNVLPMKSLFDYGKGLPITKENLVDSGVKVISYGQIHAKFNKSVSIDEKLYRFVEDKYLENNPECIVKKHDYIFADTSEDVKGTCDFIHIDNDETIFAGYHCIILKNKGNFNPYYLSYQFLSDDWREFFRCRVGGVKLFSLTKKLLNQGHVILPPIDVQNQIVQRLNEKCKTIDSIIEIKKEKIEKLEEYKKSLIYEYITGKKEVNA